MNDLKYIIVIPPGMNYKGRRAIIFNGMITHSTQVPEGFTVVSAGFCGIQFNNSGPLIKAWGNSESLKLESKPDDDKIIWQTLTCSHPIMGIYG